MKESQEIREKLIKARDERGWDNKDWSRAIGIDQGVLEQIDAGLVDLADPDSENIINIILKGSRENELPDLLRFDKPVVIAFDIHKGGGGKTTLTDNIACELGQRGYNVLVIDGDSQGDSTSTILASNQKSMDSIKEKNLYACLTSDYNEMDIRKHIIQSDFDGLDIVPSNTNLSKMDVLLSAMDFREQVFSHALEGVIQDNYYDFILVDMDKNLGLFNTTILCGCDYMMIPCECEMYHLKGLYVMSVQLEKVKRYNKNLELLGVVFNKVDSRKRSVEEAKIAAGEEFGKAVFDSMLRVDANIGNSQFAGMPVIVYSKSCRASREIRAITDEMLERIKKGKGL